MCFCLDEPSTWFTLIIGLLLTLWLIAVNVALFFTARRIVGNLRRNRLVITTEPRPEKPPKRGHGENEGNAASGGPPEDWFGRAVVFIVLAIAVGVLLYMGWNMQ